MTLFYDQFVDWPQAEQRLQEITETAEEYRSLAELLDQTTHHEIFALIFRVLPEHTHEHFVNGIKQEPHAERHVHFIRTYVPDIDIKLRETARDAHQKFFDAIHKPMVK